MFRSLTLTDFQSHQSTHLPLEPFTVIVGSSSSGKSAVVRALKLVAENRRGTDYVRQGAKTCQVALELAGSEPVLDASTVVTVERGKGVSSYTLRVAGMHNEPVMYTKCAATVPEGVTQALALGESSLWVAGQHDKLFLISDTGAEAARVLGRLTNVDVIYAAVREANRRASEARRAHSAKSLELASARETIKRYVTLPQRLAAAAAAESSLSNAEKLFDMGYAVQERLTEMRASESRLRTARASVRSVPNTERMVKLAEIRARVADRLSDVKSARERCTTATVELRPVPETENLSRLLAQRVGLRQALEELSLAGSVLTGLSKLIDQARTEAEKARESFGLALRQAGSCPLCGASAAHAQVDHVV